MFKFKDFLLDMWTSHETIIFKIAVVFYVIKFLYYTSNDFEFDWMNEIWLTMGYTIIFMIIYTIASCFDIKRAKSSPLILAHSIENNIKEYFFNSFELKNGSPGLFNRNVKFTGENKEFITYIFTPINNPTEIIHKIDALLVVLYTINTNSSEKLADKLLLYKKEAEYMLVNNVETIYETIR